MSNLTLTGLTGEGHHAMPASQHFTEFVYSVSYTSPKVRSIGSNGPFGLWNVGGFGIGAFPGDAWGHAVPQSLWFHFIRFNEMDWVSSTEGIASISGPSFWWRLISGVSLNVTMIYT